MRLIDADKLSEAMYHEAFETDTDMQMWTGGCWIRYKMFENKIKEAPTIEERKTMTHEEAVGFLQESGWLQDHDRQIYEQGKRDGIEWIPVTERLPEEEGAYIVTERDKDMEYPCYVMREWYVNGKWSRVDTLGFEVTAWMPLPKPYEKGAE